MRLFCTPLSVLPSVHPYVRDISFHDISLSPVTFDGFSPNLSFVHLGTLGVGVKRSHYRGVPLPPSSAV